MLASEARAGENMAFVSDLLVAAALKGTVDVRTIKLTRTGPGAETYAEWYTVVAAVGLEWVMREPNGFTGHFHYDDDDWALLSEHTTTHTAKAATGKTLCVCELHLLMRQGCSCGALSQERGSKDERSNNSTSTDDDGA